ncbi:MAG: BrnA antitoxin family protein [Clostridia bacterium]|nr:BrnA antitoxin family protein [Clostridia bacterium]
MKEINMKNKNENYEMKSEYDFSNGIRGRFYSPKKKSTTIRLDDDVILYFKKKASEEKVGYQTLMNAALRKFIVNDK